MSERERKLESERGRNEGIFRFLNLTLAQSSD